MGRVPPTKLPYLHVKSRVLPHRLHTRLVQVIHMSPSTRPVFFTTVYIVAPSTLTLTYTNTKTYIVRSTFFKTKGWEYT